MALPSGARLGPYEIVAPIGAGGMGEVYRARDTRLDRDVAIKILPENFSADAQLRERFEREARAISSLNHPNICTLYDVGREGGIDYLVLEYLEGESLAQRLERGALLVDQVLAYGIQIAEALERAHRQGVVHRDLKPGNVMITKNGVKLLDFGLAKPMTGASLATTANAQLTVSQHKPLTAEGTVVGTFQYMAPEQLEGHDADARSDLFAFGCVLYEMAAGKRPFDGKTQASVAAAILATEPPPISSLQPLTPPALERVVQVCVAKDPEERWQTAHDVKLQLKWIAEGGSKAGVAAPVVARRVHRERTAWIAAALALVLGFAGSRGFWFTAKAPQDVVRASILLPEKAQFTLMGRNGAPAISPDGTKVAFVAIRDGQRLIWLRSLAFTEAKPLKGTEEGYGPFWSPDGRYLAFFSQGKLRKLAVEGGATDVICDAEDARGGSWGGKDIIVFAPNRFSRIHSVPASGGTPAPVTESNQALSQRWPYFLPDGEHFLFVNAPVGSVSSENRIFLGSLHNKDAKEVFNSGFNVEFSQGKIFFFREGALNAQSFDDRTGQITGEAVPIAPDVQVDTLFSHALFSVSASGLLVYAPGSVSGLAQLMWLDHHGKELSIVGEPGLFTEVSISPDESKVVAVQFKQSDIDLWIYELARGIHTRFTTKGSNRYPLWSPDGQAVVYASSDQDNKLNIYKKSVNGDQPPELLAESKAGMTPTDWTRNGRFITFTMMSPETKLDIWLLPLSGGQKPVPFMQTPFNEKGGRFSPDGRWMAYGSDESGHTEIYLAPFPDGGRKWQVSNAGGGQPLWSKNGAELYYIALDNTVMSVAISAPGSEPKIGVPVPLFKAHPRNFEYGVYDVTRDGRFLITSAPDESSAPLTLISNWPSLLKK